METNQQAESTSQDSRFELDPLLGKQVREKITGFEGIVVTKLISLFGCNQYGVVAQGWDREKSKDRPSTEYFDEGRLEVTGTGIRPSDVQVATPGADFNADAPR